MQQSLGVDAEDLEALIYPAGPLTQLHKLRLVLPVLRDILIEKGKVILRERDGKAGGLLSWLGPRGGIRD